jgi:galactokinase
MVPLVPALEASGLGARAVSAKASLFARARQALPPDASSAPPMAFFVPGRIEVLGKHTDYAGGRSLLCAVEQGFCVVATPGRDRRVRACNAATGELAEWPLRSDIQPRRNHWSNYPATVVRRVAKNFPDASVGVDIAFASDLPAASGMSSSSAFMIGVFLALAEVNHLGATAPYRADICSAEALAAYLASIENGRTFGALVGDSGVGTFGGSEDHTAILCCRPATLSQYRFAPVSLERDAPMPAGHVLVVAFSGVLAEKTGAALDTYNRASRAAARVLEIWQQASGRPDATLEAAVSADPGAADEIRRAITLARDDEFGAARLTARFEQFVLESRSIIPAAGDALLARDLARFGELVDRSQDAAERWLGNQVPETVGLARSARELGAVAASAFGAGFGGSVWALVPEVDSDRFSTGWERAYRQRHPGAAERAVFFQTAAGPAAMRIERLGDDHRPMGSGGEPA